MLITMMRKPIHGNVAGNVLEYGGGGLNIDATRVPGPTWKWGTQTDIRGGGLCTKRPSQGDVFGKNVEGGSEGRWPANTVFLGHCEFYFFACVTGVRE